MTTTTVRTDEKADARDRLSALLPPGTTVYGIVRTVSRSGMSRTIDFYVFPGGEPVFLSALFARLLGLRQKEGALVVRGCGMDMVFSLVYDVSAALHGDGYALTGRAL